MNSRLKLEYPQASALYSIIQLCGVIVFAWPRATQFYDATKGASLQRGGFTMFGLLAISNRSNNGGAHLLGSNIC